MPDQVTPGSDRKVWWKCSKGHEWETRVASRTRGTSCPKCSYEKRGAIYRKAMLKRSGSLADKYPNLVSEWHPSKNGDLTPYNVTPGSGMKVWWKCNQEHEWEARVLSRTRGDGCKKCYDGKRSEIYRKAALKRSGSLTDKYPDLAKEWHPTKNELKPDQVTPGSNRKIWWICSQGHEWKTTVYTRTSGKGCPYCAGKYPTKENNLAVKHPELAKEWHPTKNELTPDQVTPGSSRKIWWKCSHDHEWEATVYTRKKGHRCPYCSGLKASKDYNLAVKYPDLAREWHPTKNGDLTPYDVTPGSIKKVWWRCSQEHEWEASPNMRTRGTGCPICSVGRRLESYEKAVLKRSGSLAEKYPSLVKEWHPVKNRGLAPYDVTPGSNRKVWWMCERGHEWEATVLNRTYGSECPHCRPQTSRIEIRFYCELKMVFDDAKWREKIDGIECDIYLPKYKIGVEIDGYPWHEGKEKRDRLKGNQLLEKGVTVFRVRDKRLNQIAQTDIFYSDKEEPLFAIKRLLKNLMENVSLTPKNRVKISEYQESNQLQNREEYRRIVSALPSPLAEKSLALLHPELEEEWNYEKNAPLEPRMFSPGSDHKIWWICDQGHEWKASIYARTSGSSCPKCFDEKRGVLIRKAAVERSGSLADKYPGLAMEWHPTKNGELTPDQIAPRSPEKVWWRCSQGHEYDMRIADKTGMGLGCPYCSRRRVGEDNNLAVLHPQLVKEWHPTKNKGLKPSDVTPGSGKKVWWRCSKGHEWKAEVKSRVRGNKCPYCSGRKASKDYNLAVKYPELAKEWHPTKNRDLTPYDLTPGSKRKVWWRCDQGHEWKAMVLNRSRGTGCPHCYKECRRTKRKTSS